MAFEGLPLESLEGLDVEEEAVLSWSTETKTAAAEDILGFFLESFRIHLAKLVLLRRLKLQRCLSGSLVIGACSVGRRGRYRGPSAYV